MTQADFDAKKKQILGL
ncbi:hypothetical protein [Lactiplantibacillus plantarum]